MRPFLFAFLALGACARPGADAPAEIPFVVAQAETQPVGSEGDAADDPAIWINETDPAASIILGTDKKAGLYLYDLKGAVKQFLPAGKLNNVDLRQNVTVGGWTGDLAAATNRTDDTITLIDMTGGEAKLFGAFPSVLAEPYGLCMGRSAGEVLIFVPYKTGDVVAYRLQGPGEGDAPPLEPYMTSEGMAYRLTWPDGAGVEASRLKLDSQAEGCVFDDETGLLYVAEEDRGIWKASYTDGELGAPTLIDEVGGASGVAADVEGLALYKTGARDGYLIASSQGNDSYAVYKLDEETSFIGRFAVKDGDSIDGTSETDGVEASSAPLGAGYPEGVLIVQDGANAPDGETQNFKIIDWRQIEAALGLQPAP